MTDKKTLDAATRSAFEAGVAFAQNEADGWPGHRVAPSAHEAYGAWREQWTGRPHEPQEQAVREVPRATQIAPESPDRCPYYRDRAHRAECYMPGRGHMARTGMEVGG